MRIGCDTLLRNRGPRARMAMLDGFRERGIRTTIGAAALVACGLSASQARAALIPDRQQVRHAMNWNSADQFVKNMNTYNGTGHLGQTNWELPPMDSNCGVTYNCASSADPL